MRYLLFGLFFTALSIPLSSCSKGDNAGNSIETENAISFQVVYADGRPAVSTLLRIRPIWFVADTMGTESDANDSGVQNLLTDANGKVVLDSMPSGFFLAEASVDSLAVSHEFLASDSNASGYSRRLVLVPMGSISGSVNLPDGAGYAWVFVLGMDRAIKTDSDGRFLFENLPAGALRVQAVVPGVESQVGEALVVVRSESHTEIGTVSEVIYGNEDLELWQFARAVEIDTLISDWMQPASVPLVLTLRLDSSNFDFSQAMDKGQDIRITDLSGRVLPMARAYWDQDRSKGVVRFRVDENIDLEQGIQLWWGRASAPEMDDENLWNGIGDSLKKELYTLNVDDFEDSLSQSSLPLPIAENGWYFLGSDSTVTFSPTLADGILAGQEDAGVGRAGKAMHFQFSTQHDGSYLLFGMSMGAGKPRDYSAMDSIVFWVRGAGSYMFALDQLKGDGGKASYRDTLDSAWTKQVIRPSDFRPGDNIGGNVGWELVRDSITNITFMVYGNGDFWVDDIRIYGLNRDDLK